MGELESLTPAAAEPDRAHDHLALDSVHQDSPPSRRARRQRDNVVLHELPVRIRASMPIALASSRDSPEEATPHDLCRPDDTIMLEHHPGDEPRTADTHQQAHVTSHGPAAAIARQYLICRLM